MTTSCYSTARTTLAQLVSYHVDDHIKHAFCYETLACVATAHTQPCPIATPCGNLQTEGESRIGFTACIVGEEVYREHSPNQETVLYAGSGFESHNLPSSLATPGSMRGTPTSTMSMYIQPNHAQLTSPPAPPGKPGITATVLWRARV